MLDDPTLTEFRLSPIDPQIVVSSENGETAYALQTGYSSADNAVAEWSDWEWDSIIILPLVRLKNEWTEIGETVIVNRVYVFPYKKYHV